MSSIWYILYLIYFSDYFQMHWKGIYCIADKNNNDKDHDDDESELDET